MKKEPSLKLHKEYGVNPTIPICFICLKPKDEIVLLGAGYKEEAPKHMLIDDTPCDECKKKLKQYVALIVLENNDIGQRTGELAFVSKEHIRNIMKEKATQDVIDFMETKSFIFVDKETFSILEHKLHYEKTFVS